MGRIIIVSNRVGSLTSVKSNQGGLASAMSVAIKNREAVWFGWSGEMTAGEPGPTRLLREGRLTRALVDLSREDYERYYAGFANRMLWPLLHYRIDLPEFHRDDHAGYCRVNALFAERLAPMLEPDDLIWVHDYHLIPLGEALRRLGVVQPLGFFLHTPFPGPDLLTTLPVHEEIVRPLFAYDLVGFQTENDVLAFTDYITREAEGEVAEDGTIRAYGSELVVGAFPIGIDPERVALRAARAVAGNQCRRLHASLSGRQLVIGVDRLDYTKGLIERFAAVERLLEKWAHYRRGIVLLQIAPPTRGDVPEYQQIRAELDARAGHINGQFGEPDVLPVRYLNRHFGQESLFGFYRLAAVGLVTPLRDGMNLVAKEFVASQDPADPGVLVLSPFAGAAGECRAALIVNPYDIDGVVQALDRALGMALDERRERHQANMQALRQYDIHRWCDHFIETLTARGRARAESARAPPVMAVLD